jgi:hypothetical protein
MAAPLLNGHDEVGDGRWRAPRGGKEWGRGVGGSTTVGRRGVAGTGLEPMGAGGRRVQAQNRGGGVAARWGLGIVPGGVGQKWFKLFQKFNLFQKRSNFF